MRVTERHKERARQVECNQKEEFRNFNNERRAKFEVDGQKATKGNRRREQKRKEKKRKDKIRKEKKRKEKKRKIKKRKEKRKEKKRRERK